MSCIRKCLGVSTLLIALTSPSWSAEVLEDFDNYSTETPWRGSGQWIIENPEAMALGEGYRRGEAGMGILFGAEGAAMMPSPIYKMGLKLAGEVISARCYINVRSTTGRFDFYTRGGVEDGDAQTISHVVLENGKIYYGVYGGGLQAISEYHTETWINLTVQIDLKNQRYDIYVDDVLIHSDAPFAAAPGMKVVDVDSVVIAKNAEGTGQAWVDDVSVIIGTAKDLANLTPSDQAAPSNWKLDLTAKKWARQGAAHGGSSADAVVEKNALGAIVSSGRDRSAGSEDKARHTPTGTGMVFSLQGIPTKETSAQWQWKSDQPSRGTHLYYSIRYKAKGISRKTPSPTLISASGFDGQGKRTSVVLLDAGEIITDGRSHTLQGKLKNAFTPASLLVDLITKNSGALLEIESVTFSVAPEENPLQPSGKPVASKGTFESIDLSPYFNDSITSLVQRLFDKKGRFQDGAGKLPSGSVNLSGVPFQLGEASKNLILPVEDRSANRELIPFLGTQVTRANLGPIGREDVVTIPVQGKASEVFFLLVNEFETTRTRYGAAPIPFQFDDIYATFCAELHYADGEIEKTFPFSIFDEEYVLRRTVGAYVVAANAEKELKEIRLINRAHRNTTGLAALTLNKSPNRLFPNLVTEPELIRVPAVVKPKEAAPYLKQVGQTLTGGNSYYQFAVDLSNGFRFSEWVNHWTPGSRISFHKDSGFELLWKDRVLDGSHFKVTKSSVEGSSAQILLTSKVPDVPLDVTIRLSVGVDSLLKTSIAITNRSATAEAVEVRFPFLKDIVVGDVKDTWLFFPKYGNVNSNKPGYFEGANDLMFPMQFFDIYNPRLGGGIGLITDNRQEVPLRYVASKGATGAAATVRYPGEFCHIAPGNTREYPETSLIAHGGDWHEAFSVYKDWLTTWYKPYRSQDKAWFIDDFWVHTQITSKKLADAILLTPPLYDATAGKYWVDEVLEADKRVFGSLPDVINLFAWGYSDQQQDFLYSGSPSEAYEGVGGVSLFKDAITQFQDKHHIPVSLYLYPGPCGKKTAFGREFGEAVALQRADGSYLSDSENWYACPGSKQWRDYFVDMTKTIQQDTGAKIIYLDVFGYSDAFSCHSTDHGHEVPYVGGQGSTPLAKALKEALPADTVLWHEYPVNDVTAQYSDGNITYYYLPVRDLICPVYNVEDEAGALLKVTQDVYRYAFPHLKQFGFPCGIEEDSWGHLKFPFFNGEGTFDTTWRLYAHQTQDLLAKSLELKRRYVDCFTTLTPEPLVPTERAGVFANKFPGKNRTLWTLYNERMTTVRGTVLAIPHIEGATYEDIWNGVPLQPRIENGMALIDIRLDPQAIGAITQTVSSPVVRN